LEYTPANFQGKTALFLVGTLLSRGMYTGAI